MRYEGLRRTEWEEGCAGDIVAVAGLPEVGIGDTLAGRDDPHRLPPIPVDEPTIAMVIGINASPMAGREGQHVTSRKLKGRLDTELLTNVSIRVQAWDTPDAFQVVGRGELQLAILSGDDAPRGVRDVGGEA